MTSKELLNPRYEVLKDYPKSPFSVGDILHKFFYKNSSTGDYCFVTKPENPLKGKTIDYDLDKFPHLFCALNWWEKRNIEDMPKRLICRAMPNDEEVIEIQEWDMNQLLGWRDKENRKCASLTAFNPEYGYFPVD